MDWLFYIGLALVALGFVMGFTRLSFFKEEN